MTSPSMDERKATNFVDEVEMMGLDGVAAHMERAGYPLSAAIVRNARVALSRQLEMVELLTSTHAIALRNGEGTAWARLAASIQKLGIGAVTPRTYRVLPGDIESEQAP